MLNFAELDFDLFSLAVGVGLALIVIELRRLHTLWRLRRLTPHERLRAELWVRDQKRAPGRQSIVEIGGWRLGPRLRDDLGSHLSRLDGLLRHDLNADLLGVFLEFNVDRESRMAIRWQKPDGSGDAVGVEKDVAMLHDLVIELGTRLARHIEEGRRP